VVDFGQVRCYFIVAFSWNYEWHGACKYAQRRNDLMKKKMLVLLLMGASSVFGADVYFGIGVNIGRPGGYVVAPRPPAPPAVRYAAPRSPGRGYVWVPGYWDAHGRNYRWRDGYWTKPPRRNARWVEPRYRNDRYYSGYWR
jgi:hypothetical protein